MIPSDIKSILWDAKIDWMELSDIELFYMLTRNLSVSKTKPFFGNVDFSKFILIKRDDGTFMMYDQKNDIKIDFYIHMKMQKCLCQANFIKKKVERAGNKYTKMILIEEDREKRKLQQDKEFKSNLYGLVSALVNYPGFKYNYSTVWDLTMYQFMDAVKRTRIIDSTNHLMMGIYTGNIDSKKIQKNKMDWMRELHNDD